MTNLMEFITNSCYDYQKNELMVTINKHLHTNIAYRSKRRKSKPSQEQVSFCLIYVLQRSLAGPKQPPRLSIFGKC